MVASRHIHLNPFIKKKLKSVFPVVNMILVPLKEKKNKPIETNINKQNATNSAGDDLFSIIYGTPCRHLQFYYRELPKIVPTFFVTFFFIAKRSSGLSFIIYTSNKYTSHI